MLVTKENYIMFIKHNLSKLQFGLNSTILKRKERTGKGMAKESILKAIFFF